MPSSKYPGILDPYVVNGLLPISGAVSVSNFPSIQLVSAAALPLPTGAATDASLQALLARQTSSTATITVSPIVTLSSVKLISANPNRKGLWIWNNSANSGYIALGSPANSATNLSQIIPTFTTFVFPNNPMYLGDIYAIRNAGTGTFVITELT